jgi:hypothetical protein
MNGRDDVGAMRRTLTAVIVGAIALPLVAGCQAAPRVRPVKMGPTETGPNSVEAERRRLHGTWELVSLELFSPSGEKHAVHANGQLQYDDYGNLSIHGTIEGSEQVDSSVLNVTGRATIDPVTHTLRYQDIESKTADERRVDPRLDWSRARQYEFDGDLLKTTTKDAGGATTAIATWKKQS